jgi:hypothetical protein
MFHCVWLCVWFIIVILHVLYREFHNILPDYKHLWQEDQRSYLSGTVHRHRKSAIFFLTTRDVRCVHHGCLGTYRYDIKVLATHAPTWKWPFSHYIHSHRLAAEMWTMMKNNFLGKQFLSCSFYLYRFPKYVYCGFRIINLCNPRVHYETLWILLLYAHQLEFFTVNFI